AIGSLKCTPFECDRGAESLLTEWVRQGYAVEPFYLGESCELVGPKDGRSITAKKHDMSSEEIGVHLNFGLRVEKASLFWGEDLFFTLDAGLGIKKLDYSDAVSEQVEYRKPESAAEEFDATFFIMSETLRRFVKDLAGALGGEVGSPQEGE
ncbi:MAG TPA: recombination-associated protein RdgC, partial [Cellvibrionaceae bacterium]|nr:recombination-associated protein RdgC [Cellvibrionaceae bacterium]